MKKTDRVRESTSESINKEVDVAIYETLNHYYNQPHKIDRRLKELDKEWDIERVLELNASTFALAAMVLGLTVNRKWFMAPIIVTGFLAQHAIQGWCPPVPLLRLLGVRTRKEIDKEKYALKTLRGDFRHLLDVPNAAWHAVNK